MPTPDSKAVSSTELSALLDKALASAQRLESHVDQMSPEVRQQFERERKRLAEVEPLVREKLDG
jgi:hypothetical protein